MVGQCLNQVTHLNGSMNINGTNVTISSLGSVSTNTSYCPAFTTPYLVGQVSDGSYTFQFSPPIDSISLNFSAITNISSNKDIVKLTVNGSHYPLTNVGNPISCPQTNSIPILNLNGNMIAPGGTSAVGCVELVIPGPISQIEVLDSVVGFPAGVIFSLFICNESTSINTKSNTDNIVNIYPNPTTTHFTIEGINKPYNLTINNALGQLLYRERRINEQSKKVDVSQFPKGILFIRIEAEGKVIYRKVVRQ